MTLRDRGPYYELSIVPGIDPQDLTRVGKVAQCPRDSHAKNRFLPEDLPPQLVVDYEPGETGARPTSPLAMPSRRSAQAMRQGSASELTI